MPAADFLSITADIAREYPAEQITVVLTGGEPLLRKDLPEIGFRLREQGFRWGMVSNGFHLTRDVFIQLLNAGMGALTISLDGLEPTHNWLRNHPDSYRRAREAILMAARSHRLNADVVTCVHKRNLNELPEIAANLSETGIRNWRLFTISPIGRARIHDDLHLSPDEFRYLLDFIRNARLDDLQPKPAFSCESFTGSWEGEVRDGFFFCRAGIHIGSVLADGSFSACPNIDRSLVQGHMSRDSFPAVWENRFSEFRDRAWMKNGPCLSCAHYRFCEGGGMHDRDMQSCEIRRCNFQHEK